MGWAEAETVSGLLWESFPACPRVVVVVTVHQCYMDSDQQCFQ